jgi:hypothetical protein
MACLALRGGRCVALSHVLLLVGARDKGWSLFWLSNFQERMSMDLISFAFLAIIEVRADTALIADTINGSSLASIAGNFIMNLGILVSSFLAKVVNHQSLESLSCIGLDLTLDNLNQILVELVLKSTRAVASFAWKSSFVNFSAIAFKANYVFVIGNLLLFILWAKNLAVNFLGDSLSFELTALALGLNGIGTTTRGFSHIFEDLGADLFGINNRIQLLFVSLDEMRVAAKALLISDSSITSDSNAVDTASLVVGD